MAEFEIVQVDSTRSDAPEPLGTKPKFWYKDDAGHRMLFKVEARGTGEDWAEKVACQFCEILGLPHVHYELARDTRRDLPGVICANCAPRPGVLVLGNQLLLELDPNYPADESRKYKVQEHTVEAVVHCLGNLSTPSNEWMRDTPAGIETALDVFVGYVILDALIANQDRHHENWAAIRLPGGIHLAPTYDHGASFARNLSDDERHDRLTSNDVGRQMPQFASRARSAFYENPSATRPLSTLGAAQAFAEQSSDAASIWVEQISKMDEETIGEIFAQVPSSRVAEITRKFSVALISENRRRIMENLTND